MSKKFSIAKRESSGLSVGYPRLLEEPKARIQAAQMKATLAANYERHVALAGDKVGAAVPVTDLAASVREICVTRPVARLLRTGIPR